MAGNNGRTRLVLDGEREYNEAVRRINQNVKNLNSEMRLLEQTYRDNANSQEALRAKQDLLTRQIEQQKEKVEENRRMLERARAEFGENSEQVTRFSTALNNAQVETARLENELRNLNNQAFGRNFREMGEGFTKGGESLQNISSKLNAVSGAATVAATALGGLVVKAGVFADDMNTLSKITSVSTEDLQKFAYASDLVDVSVETYSSSLKKLTKNMQSAQEGSTAQVTAFKELGVSWQDAEGNLRNSNDVFYDLIDAMGEIDNTAQRDAYAMDIFGKSATELNPLISVGADEIKRLGEEAKASGAILSQDTLDALNAFNDKIDTLKAKMSGQLLAGGANFIDELEPILENVINLIEELMHQFNSLTDSQQKNILKGLIFVATISKTTAVVGTLASGIGAAITAGVKFVGAIKAGETAMAAFNVVCAGNPIGAVVTVVGLAVAAFTSWQIATALVGSELTETEKKAKELKDSIDSVKDSVDNANSTFEQSVKSIDDNVKAQNAKMTVIEKLLPRLEELDKETNRTITEEKEFNDIIAQINKAMPDLNLFIDNNTGKLNLNTEAIKNNIEQLKAQIQLQAQKDKMLAEETKKIQLEDEYAKAQANELAAYTARAESQANLNQKAGAAASNANRARYKESQQAYDEARAETDRIRDELNNLNETLENGYSKIENTYKKSSEEIAEVATDVVKVATAKELAPDVQGYIDNWEYLHSAGEISEQEYLNALGRIRDNYFTKDSEGWRSYNLKYLSQQKAINQEALSNQNAYAKDEETLAQERLKAQQEAEQARLKALEDARKEELSLLKWRNDMGYISDEQYYNQLTAYRDKYFSEGSEEWRNYTLQIKQYTDKIAKENYTDSLTKGFEWIDERNLRQDFSNFDTTEEDSYNRLRDRAKKAYESGLLERKEYYAELDKIDNEEANSYSERQDFSENWINERDFYEDWEATSTNKVDSIKRLMARAEEYYNADKISYKKYVEDIKKYSKELYTAQKEAQQQAYENVEAQLDKFLSSKKLDIDTQISALNDEVSQLRNQQTQDNRITELNELKAEANKYSRASTLSGQEHYKDLQAQIKKLEQEEEVYQLEIKNNEIIKNLNDEYDFYEKLKTEALSKLETVPDVLNNIDDGIKALLSFFNNLDYNSIMQADKAGTVVNYNYNTNNTNNVNANNNITDNVDASAMVTKLINNMLG